jgi:hypothetical protein
MSKVFSFLYQPYPFESYSNRSHLRKIAGILAQGVFIALFLILFKPFDISRWKHPHMTLTLIGFGLITSLAGVMIQFVLVPIFPKYFAEDKWTVGREILMLLLLILLIALGNFGLLMYLGAQGFNFSNFLNNVFSVVIVGAFPITFGILINYIFQLRKFQKEVKVRPHEQSINSIKEVVLIAENEKDTLTFLLENLLYIESADNYAIVHLYENGVSRKEMLRSSLTRLEGQINKEEVVRCHRSFIVNLYQVEEVSGNAQGYKLHLKNCETLVPVARKYSEIVEKLK